MSEALCLDNYVFQILDNNLRIQEVIGESQWNLDIPKGTLTFTGSTGAPVATCPIQLVGSEADNTWLWSWANEASAPPESQLAAVQALKTAGTEAFYQQNEAFPLPSATFGHEMAILCAGVSGGYGTFRCPYSGGALYVVIESFTKARALPTSPLRTTRAIMTAISTLPIVDHRAAVRAFPGAERFTIAFDERDRIADIQAQLTPEADQPQKSGLLARLFGKRNG